MLPLLRDYPSCLWCFPQAQLHKRIYRWRCLVNGLLWRGIGIAILLVVLWVVVRLVLGIASALIHLLLFVAALVLVYVVVRRVMARGLQKRDH